jgi:hypothetical protein
MLKATMNKPKLYFEITMETTQLSFEIKRFDCAIIVIILSLIQNTRNRKRQCESKGWLWKKCEEICWISEKTGTVIERCVPVYLNLWINGFILYILYLEIKVTVFLFREWKNENKTQQKNNQQDLLKMTKSWLAIGQIMLYWNYLGVYCMKTHFHMISLVHWDYVVLSKEIYW